MGKKRQKIATYTTPKVGLKWANLFEPKLKYEKDDEFEYVVNIVMEPDEAKAVIGAIEAELDKHEKDLVKGLKAAWAKSKKKNDKNKKPERHVNHWPEVDKDGEETGRIEMQIKTNDVFKDKKTGKIIDLRPAIFDAGKNPMKPVEIWNGSLGKVFMQLRPFSMSATGLYGISTRLKGVQILELVSSSMSADQMGFADEEDGYTQGEMDDDNLTSDDFGADSAEDDEEDGDF